MAFPTADISVLEVRLRNLRAGFAVTALCALIYGAYNLLTWSQPNRPAMLLVTAAALAGVLALGRMRLDELMRRPVLREAFFIAWSGSLIAAITVMVGLDGGVGSPLSVSYFLPLAFAALSYPVASMLVVGGLTVVAYGSVAVSGGGVPAPDAVFVGLALCCATWVCAWQARNHERQRRQLAQVSRADPLTGALNRRGFDERFAGELSRAERSREALALIMLDLDDFKSTNDRHGHAAGDDVLRWAVRTMAGSLRPSDAVARLGGDEFAVLAPGAGQAEAAVLAGRLVAALAERAPASAGVATYPLDGVVPEALQQVADLDLYAVKHGRAARAVAGGPRELTWATTLARAVDQRMAVRHEHSATVARHAVAIGERMGFDHEQVGALRLAGVLHDVGKMAVPESILRKPGRLTDAETEIVRVHPVAGADMIARIDGLEIVARWIRHSHEHVDGSGYPDGLAGEEIPLEARILLVADAFDAMTSERTYSAAMSVDDALAELRRCAGTQFDERCVELLAAALDPERAGPVDDVVALA